MAWNKIKLGEILTESKIISDNPNSNKRIRVRLNLEGVEKRPETNDKSGATQYYKRKSNQFIYGKQNLFKGAFGIIPKDLDGFESSSDLPAFDIDESCSPEWIFYYFKQGNFYETLVSLSTGTGSRRVQPKKLYELEIPLPSIEEQNKIIQKIKEKEKIFENLQSDFDAQLLLFKKLRERIHQEAVSGELVEQNPQDEPASILLEKIKKEKEELIKEKKIKKDKPLREIGEEEIPYQLPNNWKWVRLGEICIFNPRNYLDDELEVSFIPMKLIKDGFYNKHSSEIRKWKEIKSGFTHFAERDLVFAKITPCFENRKSALLKNLKNNFGAGTTELIVLRTYKELVLPELLFILIKSENFIKLGTSTYTGTAGQQRVKTEVIRNMVIGLPPLNEQQRIVEKVDTLMQFCDELEEEINNSKEQSQQLMQSVLREAFKEE